MFRFNILHTGLFAAVLAVGGVGCTQQKINSTGESSNSTELTNKGNGDSYAGKTYNYTIPVACSDGSNVVSSIAIDLTGAMALVRDNCERISPPRLLTDAEVNKPDNGVSLIYQDRVYVETQSPVLNPLTPPTSQMICSGGALYNPGDLSVNGVDAGYSKFSVSIVWQSPGKYHTSGALNYFASNNVPLGNITFDTSLTLLAGSSAGIAPQAEYYTDDGSALESGYKAILDLSVFGQSVTTTTNSTIMFWPGQKPSIPGYEFSNVTCSTY